MKKMLAISIILTVSALAYAHSGGTDRYGCHTDRSTGIYHCH
jgi:hypothetical protein